MPTRDFWGVFAVGRIIRKPPQFDDVFSQNCGIFKLKNELKMNELQQLNEHKTFLLNSIQQFSKEISDGRIVAAYADETNRATVTAANAHRIEQYSQLLQKVEAKIQEKCKK